MVWTDFIQGFIMFAGLLVVLIVVCNHSLYMNYLHSTPVTNVRWVCFCNKYSLV